jgi:hypothetical protein
VGLNSLKSLNLTNVYPNNKNNNTNKKKKNNKVKSKPLELRLRVKTMILYQDHAKLDLRSLIYDLPNSDSYVLLLIEHCLIQ